MKSILMLCCIIPLVFSPAFGAKPDEERGKSFIHRNKQLSISERRARSKTTIETSSDDLIVAEAARDLAFVSVAPEEAEKALSVLETLSASSEKESLAHVKANLGIARVLTRLGRADEAKEIYERALAERWHKDTYKSLNEAFTDIGDHEFLAVKAYELRTGIGCSFESREFHEIPNDFLDMFFHLRALAVSATDYSCVQQVLPKLKSTAGVSEIRCIAEAMCLAADDRYEEASALLQAVDAQLQSTALAGIASEESKNIPLYISALLFFEGADFDAARQAFRDYMDRNVDDRTNVLARGLKITYTMELSQSDLRKIPELTGFLLQSEYCTDEVIRRELTERRMASLSIMHQVGLAWQGDWDGAGRICEEIMADYYPETLTGAGAAMNWGLYLWQRHKDYDAAEAMFRDILERAPFDGIVPHVKRMLAKLLARRGEHESALVLLDDTIQRLDPAAVGSKERSRRRAITLRHNILQKMKARGEVPMKELQSSSGRNK